MNFFPFHFICWVGSSFSDTLVLMWTVAGKQRLSWDAAPNVGQNYLVVEQHLNAKYLNESPLNRKAPAN